MKRFFLLFLALYLVFLFSACGEAPAPESSSSDPVAVSTDSDVVSEETVTLDGVMTAFPHYVGLADQGNSRVVVYDLAVEDWSLPEAMVWEFRHDYCFRVAGLKLRHNDLLGGDVVLFCGPKGGTIVSYETKEILYHTSDFPANPHSVELLPDGTFFVAGTQGEAVYAYNALSDNTKHTAVLKTPADCHGVLWDPEYDMLWTAGSHIIESFAVSGGPEKPAFSKIYSYADLPSAIHDLATVYGNTERLWFTCEKGIAQMEKETGKTLNGYTGSQATSGVGYTPGVGSFSDGVLVWTSATGKTDEWTTDILRGYAPLGEVKFKRLTYTAPDDAWYKCRVWISDYQ